MYAQLSHPLVIWPRNQERMRQNSFSPMLTSTSASACPTRRSSGSSAPPAVELSSSHCLKWNSHTHFYRSVGIIHLFFSHLIIIVIRFCRCLQSDYSRWLPQCQKGGEMSSSSSAVSTSLMFSSLFPNLSCCWSKCCSMLYHFVLFLQKKKCYDSKMCDVFL